MSPSCFCCFMLLLFLKFFSNYCKHKTSLNEKNANIIQNKSRIATKCPLLRHTANKHTNTTSQVIIQRGWSQCFLLNTQDLCIKLVHNINWSNHILLNFFKYRSALMGRYYPRTKYQPKIPPTKPAFVLSYFGGECET